MNQCAWCRRQFEGVGYGPWGITFCSARCAVEAQQAKQIADDKQQSRSAQEEAVQEATRQQQAAEEARRWAALPEDEKLAIRVRELEQSAVPPTFHAWLRKKFPPFALLPDTNPNRGTLNSAGARATWMVLTLVMLFAGLAGIISFGQRSVLLGLVCFLPSLFYFGLLAYLVPCYFVYLYNQDKVKRELNPDRYDEIDHLRAKLARLRKSR